MNKNKKKRIFIGLGLVALIVALFVGSYIIRQNQQLEILPVSEMMNNEDIGSTTTEYGTTLENEITDNEKVDEIESGSELLVEPTAKLDKMYEDAMADSDLDEVEKEQIRFMVWKENKDFEEALQAVRPGSKVVYEETETQTANNQKPQQPTVPSEPANNNNNTLKPITSNTNDDDEQSLEDKQTALKTQLFEEKYAALNSQSFEKKRAALLAGIEELKVKFPGYNNEWDIVAKEFYTEEEIRTQNPLDQLCVLEMYTEQRGGKPPMKGIQESEMCEWKHMPTFTADMEEHDPENCCICTPELAGEGEHEIKYYEVWGVY